MSVPFLPFLSFIAHYSERWAKQSQNVQSEHYLHVRGPTTNVGPAEVGLLFNRCDFLSRNCLAKNPSMSTTYRFSSALKLISNSKAALDWGRTDGITLTHDLDLWPWPPIPCELWSVCHYLLNLQKFEVNGQSVPRIEWKNGGERSAILHVWYRCTGLCFVD